MKKLFSLFVLVLLSSQMWAVSPNASKTVARDGSGAGTYIVYSLSQQSYKIGSTTYYAQPIDMGTGIAWADRNVGASDASLWSGRSAGSFFQWGKTTAMPNNSSGYPTTGNYGTTTPTYNATSKSLNSTYDAATQVMGTNWRTPTVDEWTALKNNVNTNYSNKGTFTSKTNGNALKISYQSGIINLSSKADPQSQTYGYYWTSTWAEGTTIANMKAQGVQVAGAAISLNSGNTYKYAITNGLQVRAVYVPSFTVYTLTIKAGTKDYIYKCESGQKITITPNAGTDYKFNGWSKTSGTDLNLSGNQFTVTGDATYTANFVEDVSYVTATFKNADNTTNFATQQVVSGQTPTAPSGSPSKASTAAIVYTFDRWNTAEDGTGNGTNVAISSATTYYPIYTETARTYTIRFLMDDGETVINGYGGQVAYGFTPTAPATQIMTKMGDTYWTYEFEGWDANNDGVADGVSTVTKDQDYVAVFTKISTGVIPPHNLKIGAATNGYVTLTPNTNSITVTVPAAGETYQYPEGTNIIVEAVPARGYHFTQWSDASTAKRRLISEIEDDWDLTATFAPNVAFNMLDTWDYDDCISNYNMDDVLTVTLTGRTFTAGQWATLSVPFDYTLTADDALYNAIYKFTNVTLSSGGSSVFLEFVRTNDIEKNEPYLVVPRQAGINEVVFDGVKLETPVQKTPTTDNRVAFVSTLWQQEISGPNDFYIGKLSTLYYAPNSGMTIKGNRAFFRKIGDADSAPRRAIIVIDGEEVEVEIAGDTIEEVQDVRKYMENGILIIERNGVRMDAQGKRIN